MRFRISGLVLIVIGVLALLQSSGQYHFGLEFWPAVLVVLGGSMIIHGLKRWPPRWFSLALGLYAGGYGLLEILNNAGVTPYDGRVITAQTWPLLLIAIGLSIVFGRRSFIFRWGKKGSSRNEYRAVGDMRYGQTPWRLEKDFTMEHGIGDVKVDLTSAEITEGDHRITVKAAVGDLVVRVPDNVNVHVEAKVGIGDLVVLGQHRSGLGLGITEEQLVAESNIHLHIDAGLGIGNLRVIASQPLQSRLVL